MPFIIVLAAAAVIGFFILIETGISIWLNSGIAGTNQGSSKDFVKIVKRKLEGKRVS